MNGGEAMEATGRWATDLGGHGATVGAPPEGHRSVGVGVRVDAVGLKKTVGGSGPVLLHDVSFSIQPGELVAIAGASGAGKSTLMDVLTGFRRPTTGQVLFNGHAIEPGREGTRGRLGYVPQDDIVHHQLTVGQGIYYAAKLRLPESTSENEIERRVAAVLDEVELTERRDVRIAQLSGGQRKRVSIAVELIAEPQVLFLDEPTSGLDPGLDLTLMVLLRRLADQGRTVVLTTHATTNVTVCDQVIFLGRGGRLCFFGPPEAALTFFGVSSFAAVYATLEQAGAAEAWAARYLNSDIHQRFVVDRLTDSSPLTRSTRSDLDGAAGTVIHGAELPGSSWRQLVTLTRRYVQLLWSDKPTLAYLVLQVPLMATFLGLVSGGDIFEPGRPFTTAQVTLTLLMLFALWVGANTACREIVKENPIYRRERLSNLRIVPYAMSKLVVLAALNLVQAVLWVVVTVLFTGVPDHGVFLPALIEMILSVWVIGVAGLAMGLFISAAAANLDLALSITPSSIIPQMLLAGVLFALPGSIDWMSNATIGKWGVNALGTTANLNRLYYQAAENLPDDPQLTALLGQIVFDPRGYDADPGPKSVEAAASSRRGHLLTQWTVLLGWIVMFVGLACLSQKRKDRVWRS